MWKRAAATVPDADAQMRAHLMAQIAVMKGANVAKGSPWYLLLGHAQSGKSALMRALGMRRADEVNRDQHAPTLWFGDAGVMVEVPAHYSETTASSAFKTLLRIIMRQSGSRGITGVLLLTDAQTIAPMAHVERDAQAAQLRALSAYLGIAPPVYLMVTQCDRMAGFFETFAGLDTAARQQILGFTCSDDNATDVGAMFAELVRSVRTHATLRLDVTQTIDLRQPVFLFPQQFARLEPGLQTCIDSVFAPSHGPGNAYLRGVYFCSTPPPATQDNQWLMPAGLQHVVTRLQRPEMPRSFFVDDVVKKVLRADRTLPQQNNRRGWRGVWQRHRTAVVATAAAVMLTLVQLNACVHNAAAIEAAHATLQDLQQDLLRRRAPTASLAALGARVQSTLDQVRQGPPWAWRWGMYQGDAVVEPIASVYAGALHSETVRSLVEVDIDALQALWRTYELNESVPTGSEYSAAATRLKMHMLLTRPRDVGEPPLDDVTAPWLAGALTQRWADLQAVEPSPEEQAATLAHMTLYTSLLEAFPHLASSRQPDVVSRTRAVLARMPTADALVEQLVDAASVQVPALTLQDMLGGSLMPLRARDSIPGVFTRSGWQNVAEPWLESQMSQNDGWVFARDDRPRKDGRQLALEVRSRYFARYIEAWQRFLDGLMVVPTPGATATLAGLQSLTRGEPLPYHRLFAAIADNTRLVSMGRTAAAEDAAGELVAAMRQKLRIGQSAGDIAGALMRPRKSQYLDARDVEEAFADFVAFGAAPVRGGEANRTLPLDAYHDALIAVRNALQVYSENPREADALLGVVQTARHTTRSLIEQRDVGTGSRPRLEALLLTPLHGVSHDLVTQARSQAGASWCTSVYAPFRQLSQMYPFATHGRDAPLSDVAEFFRPSTGRLWAFHAAELAGDIPQRGERFAFDERMGGIIGRAYNGNLPVYLQNAHAMSRALFAPGQSDLGVMFEVRLHGEGFDAVSIDLDGQKLAYPAAATKWSRVLWPGPERGQGAVLTVRGKNGVTEAIRQEGEWGMFRLLETGEVEGDPRSGGIHGALAVGHTRRAGSSRSKTAAA